MRPSPCWKKRRRSRNLLGPSGSKFCRLCRRARALLRCAVASSLRFRRSFDNSCSHDGVCVANTKEKGGGGECVCGEEGSKGRGWGSERHSQHHITSHHITTYQTATKHRNNEEPTSAGLDSSNSGVEGSRPSWRLYRTAGSKPPPRPSPPRPDPGLGEPPREPLAEVDGDPTPLVRELWARTLRRVKAQNGGKVKEE